MTDVSRFNLNGKKALVTGGAGGIGKACALGMAKAGADVAIIDLKEEWGRQTVKEIKELGRDSIFINCDVSDVKQVETMVKEVVDTFGRLDIAFNNAGTTFAGGNTIGDDALDVYHNTMKVDLDSVFYCCREEAKYMVPQKYGKIINTASTAGNKVLNMPNWAVTATLVAYGTAKAGVIHLSKILAIEWAEHNVYVNSISPGYIKTPLAEPVHEIPGLLEHQNETTPFHRQGEAEELVGGVLYLASDASSFTTGQNIAIDGGYTAW
jgi:NAD(P)-dependent dehydrogenase (short-subunit alcohol dehydrogenase family)